RGRAASARRGGARDDRGDGGYRSARAVALSNPAPRRHPRLGGRAAVTLSFADFWYVVEEARNLRRGQVIGRRVLGEWLAVFRDASGKACAMKDRCLHRSAQLSRGSAKGGQLTCPYHGWTYDGDGRVTRIPSLRPAPKKLGNRCAPTFETREQDGYVYVRLAQAPEHRFEPFAMPKYGAPGYKTLRLQNRFANNVTNCAENFVDIPHTAFVHEKIFRS